MRPTASNPSRESNLKLGALFAQNRSGAVALIFGLVVIPLVLLAGGAIDYERAVRRRMLLDNAADNALLAALREAREQLKTGNNNWKTIAQAAGQKYFVANASQTPGVTANAATVTLNLNKWQLTGTMNYSVNVPTSFLKMAGLSTLKIGGKASATISAAQFTDLYFLVDVSPSMGIGATLTDQQIMKTSAGCSFSCHYTTTTGTLENFPAVKATSAKTRVDVIREAIVASLNTVPKDGTTRVAIYTFSNSIMTLFPLSSNITAAITAANNIELTNAVNQGGSNITYALSQLNNMLGAAGTGYTPSSRRGVVVLATDAVENSDLLKYANGYSQPMMDSLDPNFVPFAPTYEHVWYEKSQSMNAQSCAPIKSKNYKMMALETKYLIPTADAGQPRFQFIANTLAPIIISNMQSCASSPGDYFLTNTPTEISTAIKSIFDSAIKLRLTN